MTGPDGHELRAAPDDEPAALALTSMFEPGYQIAGDRLQLRVRIVRDGASRVRGLRA